MSNLETIFPADHMTCAKMVFPTIAWLVLETKSNCNQGTIQKKTTVTNNY